MDVWNSLAGIMRVRITSAAIEATLIAANEQGVVLNDIDRINELEAELVLRRSQFPAIKKIIKAHGGSVQIIKKEGVYWSIVSFKRRPLFLAGLILYMLLAIFLPTRIFFVQTEGNSVVSSRTIAEQAQQVGISFGASRSAVRSERIKNALLAAIPELQWVGVNTYGCVAVISVKERSTVPELDQSSGVSSILAKCDGVIDEIVVTRGNVLCRVGQAVTENQMLVSGYTDCGISIKATAAEAEVYAKTSHTLQLIMPLLYTARTTSIEEITKISLVFGKNQIKLYKDSGISDAECVKMYEYSYLTLPGGFELPIGIVKETLIFYETEDRIAQEEAVRSLAGDFGSRYLKDNMVAGEILSESLTESFEDAVYKVCGRYFCREMIGKVYNEEIITGDE